MDRQLGGIISIFQIFYRDKKNNAHNKCNREFK